MGYLHIYTGDGKGKTTCAVGLAVRALGAGMRVAFLQFDKGFDGNNEHYNERAILRTQQGLDLFFFGAERIMPGGKFRFSNTPEDLEQARAGLAKATELIAAAGHEMIICDEAVTCIGTGLYSEQDLLRLIARYRETGSQCELILTGRAATLALIDAADLVTEMKMVKHYFCTDKIPARPGIDF